MWCSRGASRRRLLGSRSQRKQDEAAKGKQPQTEDEEQLAAAEEEVEEAEQQQQAEEVAAGGEGQLAVTSAEVEWPEAAATGREEQARELAWAAFQQHSLPELLALCQHLGIAGRDKSRRALLTKLAAFACADEGGRGGAPREA